MGLRPLLLPVPQPDPPSTQQEEVESTAPGQGPAVCGSARATTSFNEELSKEGCFEQSFETHRDGTEGSSAGGEPGIHAPGLACTPSCAADARSRDESPGAALPPAAGTCQVEDPVANFIIIFSPRASWSRLSQEYIDIYCTCRPKKQLKFFSVIKAFTTLKRH